MIKIKYYCRTLSLSHTHSLYFILLLSFYFIYLFLRLFLLVFLNSFHFIFCPNFSYPCVGLNLGHSSLVSSPPFIQKKTLISLYFISPTLIVAPFFHFPFPFLSSFFSFSSSLFFPHTHAIAASNHMSLQSTCPQLVHSSFPSPMIPTFIRFGHPSPPFLPPYHSHSHPPHIFT